MSIPNLGPKFVSGSAVTGQVIMTRDDDTVGSLPIVMFLGTITDVTGDGIYDITFPGGS